METKKTSKCPDSLVGCNVVMNQLDEPTTGIYIPNDIFTKAQDFIDYSKERDRLNEEEDWDGAFEVECAQRDIGLDIAIWIKGLEERIDV